MGKTYINTVKYNIKAKFEVQGLVDKHDIIGAVFGQSEGLIGEDLDLRELQKNGKIGRIDIFPEPKDGKTIGFLTVPSSLDMVQTSILAAAIESIEKVGPYESKFGVEQIEDTRTNKREEIKKRAKDLLNKFLKDSSPSTEMAEEVRNSARISGIGKWGPENLPAGPEVEAEEEVILVEGRADVLNLLKNNVKNVVGMNGSQIPASIKSLCSRKTIVFFSDGDRGGELIKRQLMQYAKVDFYARAPDGKEVEELTKKEITMSLRKKVPVDASKRQTFLKPRTPYPSTQFRGRTTRPPMRGNSFSGRSSYGERNSTGERSSYSEKSSFGERSFQPRFQRKTFGSSRPTSGFRPRGQTGPRSFSERKFEPVLTPPTAEEKKKFEPLINSVKGKMEAVLFDEKGKEIKKTKIRELVPKLKEQKNIDSIVLDGIITKRLLEEAKKHSVKYIIGVKKGKIEETKEIKTLVM